jgi:hypothetical protein
MQNYSMAINKVWIFFFKFMIKFCMVADYKYVQQIYICIKIDPNVTKITMRGNIFKSNVNRIYCRSQCDSLADTFTAMAQTFRWMSITPH